MRFVAIPSEIVRAYQAGGPDANGARRGTIAIRSGSTARAGWVLCESGDSLGG